jgi:pimeloyl-ACP methyl ester carboxylesterase
MDAAQPEAPSCSRCAPLQIAGGLTVLNGREDLFIQWTHGRALVRAYQESLGERAQLVTYDGADGAGHGLLLQHPRWVQEQIAALLRG